MHPKTAEVLAHFNATLAEFEQVCAAVPEPMRSRRAQPDRWSVAEIAAHVAVVDSAVTDLLRGSVTQARAAGLGPETSVEPVIAAMGLDRFLDRSRRIEARPSTLPPPDVEFAVAMSDLRAAAAGLESLMTEIDGLALSEVVVPNPVLGPIDVYQWVAFLAGHTSRHALQVAEASEALAAGLAEM